MSRERLTFIGFRGQLTEESPLRAIFPSGFVPLSGGHSVVADLGEGANRETARVYFVVLDACTSEQKEAIAQLMCRMGQGPIEEAREVVATEQTIPVREKNISGITVPTFFQ